MKLTAREEKIARLALDKGAKDGERQAAAIKLIESLYARGVQVEELEGANPASRVTAPVYREAPVYRDVPVYACATPEPAPESGWKRFSTNIVITLMIAVVLLALSVISHFPVVLFFGGVGLVIWIICKLPDWVKK